MGPDETPLQILSAKMIEYYGMGVPGAEQEGLSAQQQNELLDIWLPELEGAGLDLSSDEFQELIKNVREQDIVPGVNDTHTKTYEELAAEKIQAEYAQESAQHAENMKHVIEQYQEQVEANSITTEELGKIAKSIAKEELKNLKETAREHKQEMKNADINDYVSESERAAYKNYIKDIADQIGEVDLSSLSGQFNALSDYQRAVIKEITQDMEDQGVNFKSPKQVEHYFENSDLVERYGADLAEAVEKVIMDATELARQKLDSVDFTQQPQMQNNSIGGPGGP